MRDIAIYASGDRKAYAKAEAALKGFSRSVYYCGEYGNGYKLKYVANLLVTIHNLSTAEAMVMGLIKVFQSVTEGTFKADKILFNHAPNTDIAEYERIFKCPVEFNAESFQLFFSESVLNYRSLYAEPQLLTLNVKAADQHIAMLEQRDFIDQVRGQMAGLFEVQDVTLERVSANMGISARGLRHQLALANTSFQKILNDLRHRLSLRLLSQTNEGISEIIYLTGFCEQSTFYRAFRRWEGITPIEYRRKQQNKTHKG